jgi:hypothetical protein
MKTNAMTSGFANNIIAPSCLNPVSRVASVPAYDQYIDNWSLRARKATNRDVGLVPGSPCPIGTERPPIGNSKTARAPSSAIRTTRRVSCGSQGVLQQTGDKLDLPDDLRAYFGARTEDSIDL